MPITTSLADLYTRRTVQLFRFDAGARKRVRGMLSRLQTQLLKDLDKFDPTAVAALSHRQRRIVSLEKQVRSSLQTGIRDARKTLNKDLQDITNTEAKFARTVIDRALGVDLMTVSVPHDVLKTLASDAMITGTPASEYWSRIGAGTQRRFMDHVRAGVLRGDGIAKIRSAVASSLNVTRREADALTRTAVLGVANQTNEAVFAANSDVVRGVQALVTFDLRTSEICIARSGAAWNLDTGAALPDSPRKEPYPGPPPWHFNCRTVLIPVLKSLRQITGRKKDALKALPPAMRASMDGQIAADTSFAEWLRGKPRADVVELLGRTKADAFLAGELRLQDLIDQSGRPLSATDLDLL